jgi:hypothetical protein
VTGNVSGTAATVTGAAQTNITSVGTLSALTVSGTLTVDAGLLYVDATSNYVGIKTTSPQASLDIQATTGVAMRITNTGVGNSFVVEDSASTDTSPFVIDSAGRVGIGTTLPAELLDVRGAVMARATATSDGVQLVGSGSGSSTRHVTILPTTLTAFRTLTLPDKTGTVATTADLGLVFVSSGTFSGATTANLTSVFSATYDNYRLVISNLQAASSPFYLFLVDLLSGSTPAASNYSYALTGFTYAGATDNYFGASTSLAAVGVIANADSHVILDICRPFIADNTTISSKNASTFGNYTASVKHTGSTSYNGIQFSNFRLGSSSVAISGSWKLYGYTN